MNTGTREDEGSDPYDNEIDKSFEHFDVEEDDNEYDPKRPSSIHEDQNSSESPDHDIKFLKYIDRTRTE